MIAYKSLKRINGRLWSLNTRYPNTYSDESGLHIPYFEDAVVTPKIKGSKLFVYSDKPAISSRYDASYSIETWQVEVDTLEIIPHRHIYIPQNEGDAESLWVNGQLQGVPEDAILTIAMTATEGRARLCNSIKLVKKI